MDLPCKSAARCTIRLRKTGTRASRRSGLAVADIKTFFRQFVGKSITLRRRHHLRTCRTDSAFCLRWHRYVTQQRPMIPSAWAHPTVSGTTRAPACRGRRGDRLARRAEVGKRLIGEAPTTTAEAAVLPGTERKQATQFCSISAFSISSFLDPFHPSSFKLHPLSSLPLCNLAKSCWFLAKSSAHLMRMPIE